MNRYRFIAIYIALFAAFLFICSIALHASAATVCNVFNGCTGTSTAPAYGQLLIGGKSGEYELVASSTFGGGGGGGSSFSTTSAAYWLTQQTTSGLAEGSNLYFTNPRAVSALTGQNVSIFNNNAGYLTSLAGAASSTLLSDSNTFSGVNSFTNASSNFGGGWQGFSPSHFQTALGFTPVPNTRNVLTAYPLQGGGALSADLTLTTAFATTTANAFSQLQQFNASASTTALSVSGNAWLSIATCNGGNALQTTSSLVGCGSTFSTTSDAYFLSQNQGAAFSTTSATYWQTQTNFFSTTSAAYWQSVNNFFSTTSASYFLSLNQGAAFSTSSASYFLTQNQGTAFSTTSANYWGGTKGYITSALSTSTNPLMATYFVATSSTQASNLPYASTTAVSSTNLYSTNDNTTNVNATSVFAGSGSVTAPAIAINGTTLGLYWPGAGKLGLAANNNGVFWDGSQFAPVTSNARDLGGSSNIWNSLYVNNGFLSALTVSGNSTFTASTTIEAQLNLQGASSTIFSATTICLTGDTCRTTWPSGGSSASSTLLTDSNTFSGVDKFTNASSDLGGTWQTFSPSHFQVAGSYLTSAPVATSTVETAGYIPYWTSTAGTPATLGADSNFAWDPVNHRLGISTTTPAYPLDIVGTAIRQSNVTTDGTNKSFKFLDRNFTNSQNDFLLLFGQSKTSANTLLIGGGQTGNTAASAVAIFTGAGNNTDTGTSRLSIDSTGNVTIANLGSGLVKSASGVLSNAVNGTDYYSYPWPWTALTNFATSTDATTTALTAPAYFASSTIASQFPYATSTAFTTTTLCLTGDTCRTTWPSGGSTASSTLLSDNNTFSGIDKFTNASSDFGGTWQTFSPAHFLTGNQSIALSGAVSGSGTTAITTEFASTTPVQFGGTASTTLGGILAGAGTAAVKSAVVGSGLSWDGTTLSNSGITSNGGDWAGTWQGFSPSHFQTAGTSITALGNYATTTGTVISISTSTLSFNGLTAGITAAVSANGILLTPTLSGTLSNSGLANPSLTVTAGTGLSGGGSINLGNTGTLSLVSYLATSSADTAGNLAAWGSTNGTPAKLYSVSTTTVSCSGTTSCTSFTVLGSSPVTISSSGGGSGVGTIATATPDTAGQVLYYATTNGYPAKAAGVATSTPTFSSPLTTSGTVGYLVGGSGFSVGIQQATGGQSGYLSSADWTTFTGKISSSSLTAVYPLAYNPLSGSFTTALSTTTANAFNALNTFTNATSTLLTSTTAWIGTLNLTNALSIANGGTGLSSIGASSTVLTSNGSTAAWEVVGSGGGSGTVTSVASTWPITGGTITTSGTLAWGGLSTTTNLVAGHVVYSSGAGSITDIATSTPTATAPITYSGTFGSFVGGTGGTFGCTSASNGVTGCMTAADWGLLHTATTTFSTPLSYSAATNAVTCPTCNTSNASVSSVAANNGITGGTITTTGTLSLDQSFGAIWTAASTTHTQHLALNTASSTQFSSATIWNSGVGNAVWLGDANGKATAAATQTCTNQFMRAMSAAYIVTCNAVSLTADVSGILPLANGGTATSTWNTTGGIVYYDGTELTDTSTFSFAKANERLTVTNASTTAITATNISSAATTTVQGGNGVDIGNGSHGIHVIPGSSTTTVEFF